MECSSVTAAVSGGRTIEINRTSNVAHLKGVDRHKSALPDWQREREISSRLPTVESVSDNDRRNLPVLRSAVQQNIARNAGNLRETPLIDLRDDYEGNWFSKAQDVRNGYVKVLENHPQKGLYIDVRA